MVESSAIKLDTKSLQKDSQEAIQGGKILEEKPKPVARPGNIALDIERPLFD